MSWKTITQGFIQALTDLHLLEVKTHLKLSFETQPFKAKSKRVITPV